MYWTPLPPFYRQLTDQSFVGSEFSATQQTDELDDGDTEKGGRTSHETAYDLGESDDDDEDGIVMIDPVPSIARKHSRRPTYERGPNRRTRELGELSEEQDVRKGGYPTFARGGIDQPGRHVPAGIVEQGADGHVVKYIDEGGQARPHGLKTFSDARARSEQRRQASATAQTQSSLRQPPRRQRTRDGIRKDSTEGVAEATRESEHSRVPMAIATREEDLENREKTEALSSLMPTIQESNGAAAKRQSVRPTTRTLSTSQLPLPPKVRKRTIDPLTPIGEAREEPITANTTSFLPAPATAASRPFVDEPESLHGTRSAPNLKSPATDYGSLFPLPPDRPTLAIEAASSAKANRQNSGDSARKPSLDDHLTPATDPPKYQPVVTHADRQDSTLHHRDLGDVPKTPTPPLSDGNLKVTEVPSSRSSPLRQTPVQRFFDAKADSLSSRSRRMMIPEQDYFAADRRRFTRQSTQNASRILLSVPASTNSSNRPSLRPTPSAPSSIRDDSPQLRPASNSPRPSTLRSSMAIPRSPSSRSIRSTRTAQGVRFDLSPISVSSGGSRSAPTSPTGSLSPISPRKPGLRIPGTRLTVSLRKFTVPGTPKSLARESFSSSSEASDGVESDEWTGEETARPESVLSGRSSTSIGQEATAADGTKILTPKRSNTIDTLGGQHLDGRRTSHRRHSSIDSFG